MKKNSKIFAYFWSEESSYENLKVPTLRHILFLQRTRGILLGIDADLKKSAKISISKDKIDLLFKGKIHLKH